MVGVECRAAKMAGMQTALVLRPGNAALSAEEMAEFVIVTDFAQLKGPPAEPKAKARKV
jgi:methionine salvage enolase-phosphatase E1